MKKDVSLFSLNDWLVWIESFKSGGVEFTGQELTQVTSVAQKLDINKTDAKIITVGGTNGKGSCVEMLTSAYVDAGYLVGTYTSPHLFLFNERIRIQKKTVSDRQVCEAFAEIERLRGNTMLTYFEWVTLAALSIFKKAHVQVLILEVGLGGRLDATNILDADLAIITSIGLDHMDYLGHTRDAIAKEKMGICRKGRWAVCGDSSPPDALKHEALKLDTHMTYLGKDFDYMVQGNEWSFYEKTEGFAQSLIKNIQLPHLAINNAAVVLHSIILMHSVLPVDLSHAMQSIITTQLARRCEVYKMPNGATIIMDVAHNPHAAAHLEKFLQTYKNKKIIALFSMLKDKDILGTIGAVEEIIDEWHIVEMQHPRGASKEQLQKAINQHELSPQWHENIREAQNVILKQLTKEDVLVIFGSFFVHNSNVF